MNDNNRKVPTNINLERAGSIFAFLDEYGWTQNELARRLSNRTGESVNTWVRRITQIKRNIHSVTDEWWEVISECILDFISGIIYPVYNEGDIVSFTHSGRKMTGEIVRAFTSYNPQKAPDYNIRVERDVTYFNGTSHESEIFSISEKDIIAVIKPAQITDQKEDEKNPDSMKILLVIDLQKQFADNNGNYEKCIDYITGHRNEYDTVVGTYFQNTPDSMYAKHLNQYGCMVISGNDIEYPCDYLYGKTGYSANAAGNDNNVIYSAIRTIMNKKGPHSIDQEYPGDEDHPVYIMGCDSDACVLATLFDLWDKGVNFRVLSDYVYTTANGIDNDTVIKIMKRNFGDCVI